MQNGCFLLRGFQRALRFVHVHLRKEASGFVYHSGGFQFQGIFIMTFQAVVGVLAYTHHFLCQAQSEIAFRQEDTLRGVCLFAVLAGDVNHCISYLSGTDALSAGKHDPFGGQTYRAEIAGCERKGEGVAAYLVEDTADKLVVRYEVVDKVFGRVGKLRERLLHFYLFGQVYECARTLQARIPKGVQFVTFRPCGLDTLVGYLQASVSLLHLPKGIIEAQGEDLRCCGNTCSQEDDE